MSFEDLPSNEAFELYFKKHDAAKRGDLKALRELRNQHPDLFTAETENQMKSMIDYILELKSDPFFQARYKEYCRQEQRAAFTVIKGDKV